MAIYHLSIKPVSRAGGRSATAAAAYRAACLIADERTGVIHDYQRRTGVAANFIVAPDGAAWAQDRAALWNAVEAAERRKDAKVAREYQVALPHELTLEERAGLVRDFAERLCARYGVAADVAIHAPGREGDERNWHAHILTTTRAVTPDGLGAKTRVLDVATTARGEVEALRAIWEERANEHLAKAGHAVAIDRRSHLDRGIELAPTEHVGVHASQMQRCGKAGVDRVALDAETAARNAELIARRPEEVLRILTDEKAVFSRQDVARALHRYGVDEPDAFQAALARVMAADALVKLPGGERNGDERFTTTAMLAIETGMAESADRLLADRSYSVGTAAVEGALSRRPELAEEQRAAVRHVTGPERIASVIGLAGAGKSTMLGTAREAWEAAGYRAHGAALAGKAAEGLQASSGIPSRTLASWQLAWANDRHPLGTGDILVVDEAGMVSSRQLAQFLQTVERSGAKLVLVGDPEQLQPIGPGAGFRALSERTGFLELEAIRRQRTAWQRQASVALGTRETRAGLEAYRENGAIRFTADGASARERLVADYLADRAARPEASRIALAHTRADVRALNDAIRDQLRAAGDLTDEAGFATGAAGRLSFAAGDRLVFLRNDRGLGVKNGSLGTVTDAAEGRLSVALDDGRTVTIAQGVYDAVDHGYATTIHKSQGATVDRGFVLASSGMDRHLAYVALTRHRDAVGLYAGQDAFPDFEALVGRLGRGRLKTSVLDYLSEPRAEVAASEVRRPADHPASPQAAEPAVSATLVAPLKPFLAAVPYDAAAVDAVLESRVAPAIHLQRELQVVRLRVHRAVKDPASLSKAIDAELRTPTDGYVTRIDGLLAKPEAYGGLRGRKGWFAGEAKKEERERAERAYGAIREAAIALKTAFSVLVDDMRPQEERYRRGIAIEVPGLSPAAAAALTTIARTPDTDPRVLDAVVAKAVATSGQRSEIEAFASAVARRFGANGRAVDRGLGPSQGLTREEREILSGGRVVASCLAEGSLDHLIARVLRHELDQQVDVPPPQTVEQGRDLDRGQAPVPDPRGEGREGGEPRAEVAASEPRLPTAQPAPLPAVEPGERATLVVPRKPFLAAYPYDAAAIDAALERRVDPERDLKQDLDMLRYEIRMAVKEPARLFREIYDQLRTPGKGYSARIDGLLADPLAYGGLRGRKGWFVPAAETEERERAERAYADLRRSALDLKGAYSWACERARPEEERYRQRITIEVPGLSPAAAAALGKIGRTSIYVPAVFEAVMAEAVAPPEQRAEIEAFAAAVARRFGATGAIGHSPEKGLGPGQGLTREEREILAGGGFVASYLKEESLDHLIARVLRRELDQRLDVQPQQTLERRRDLDRSRDPGLTL